MKKTLLLFSLAFMSFVGMNAQSMSAPDLDFDASDETADMEIYFNVSQSKYIASSFTFVLPAGFSVAQEYDEEEDMYSYLWWVNSSKQTGASASGLFHEENNSYSIATFSFANPPKKVNTKSFPFFYATLQADPALASGSYSVTVKNITISDGNTEETLDDFTFDINYTKAQKTFDLTVTNAGMATLFLDYAVSIPEGIYETGGIYYVNGLTGSTLNMREVENVIPANTGVIVMANEGTYTFTEATSTVDPLTDNLLKGVITATATSELSDNGIYTLGRGVNSGWLGFHKYSGSTLGANKAYMTKDGGSVNAFTLQFPDGTTAIKSLQEATGQDIYDLQGRKVENPGRGVYIINGVKTILR